MRVRHSYGHLVLDELVVGGKKHLHDDDGGGCVSASAPVVVASSCRSGSRTQALMLVVKQGRVVRVRLALLADDSE